MKINVIRIFRQVKLLLEILNIFMPNTYPNHAFIYKLSRNLWRFFSNHPIIISYTYAVRLTIVKRFHLFFHHLRIWITPPPLSFPPFKFLSIRSLFRYYYSPEQEKKTIVESNRDVYEIHQTNGETNRVIFERTSSIHDRDEEENWRGERKGVFAAKEMDGRRRTNTENRSQLSPGFRSSLSISR